jgi:hypothetical protein
VKVDYYTTGGSPLPWEVTIRRPDGAPLGDYSAVRQQISAVLPGIQFRRLPSGQEKIADARAIGIEFPEVLRQHLEQQPAVEQAEFEGDGFSIQLYGFGSCPLAAFHAELRGDGDPVPVLRALCVPNGWIAVDDSSGRPMERTSESAAGWESFQAYRDQSVRKLKEASDDAELA